MANQTATAGAAATGTHETFAALDAEPAAGTPSWIHTGTRQAEAGFEDPALGWVGVRADLSGGVVHAAIVPGSTEAAQALDSHMAALNAHLAAERIPVESLSMAAATGRDSMEQNAMQPGQQGAGQQGQGQAADQAPGQGSSQGSSRDTSQNSSWLSAETRSQRQSVAQPMPPGPVLSGSAAKGSHISVLA